MNVGKITDKNYNNWNNIKITIFIPIFNELTIKEIIDKLLIQTYENFEIVLIKNFSNKSYQFFSDKRIKIFENSKDFNLIESVFFAVNKSQGDLLFILNENECIEDKDFINNIVNLWKNFKKPNMLCFNFSSKEDLEKRINLTSYSLPINNNVILENIKDFFLYDLNYGMNKTKKIYDNKFLKKNMKNIKFTENIWLNLDLFLDTQLYVSADKIVLSTYIALIRKIENSQNIKNKNLPSLEKMIQEIKEIDYIYKNLSNYLINSPKYKKNKFILDYYFEKKQYQHYFDIKNKIKNTNIIENSIFFKIFNDAFPKPSELDILQKKLKQKLNNLPKKFKYNLSIIIPIYNLEKYIERCINDEILELAKMNKIQIILIDDCSPNNIQLIFESKFKKYDFIEIHKNIYNMGSLYSRIHGLLYAESKWIHFVDGDDKICINFYQKFLFKQNKKIDCILGTWKYFWNNNVDDDSINNHLETSIKRKTYKNPLLFYMKNILLTRALWNKWFNIQSCLKGSLKILIANTSTSDDWLLNIAILSQCKNIKVVKENIYNYFLDNINSISSNIEIRKPLKFDINDYKKDSLQENMKLVKYIDERNRSYENINYLLNSLKMNKKLRYYWGINKIMDLKYVMITLTQKQMNFFLESILYHNENYIPLDFSNIIKNDLYYNDIIRLLEQPNWSKSPSQIDKSIMIKNLKKILRETNIFNVLKIIFKKIFSIINKKSIK